MKKKKISAQQRRENAMSALFGLAFAADGSYQWANVSRETIVEKLEAIKTLGKTERWITAMDKWIEVTKDESVDIVWSLLQHSVYATAASQSYK